MAATLSAKVPLITRTAGGNFNDQLRRSFHVVIRTQTRTPAGCRFNAQQRVRLRLVVQVQTDRGVVRNGKCVVRSESQKYAKTVLDVCHRVGRHEAPSVAESRLGRWRERHRRGWRLARGGRFQAG